MKVKTEQSSPRLCQTPDWICQCCQLTDAPTHNTGTPLQPTSSPCLPRHVLTRLTGCSTPCWPDLSSANSALYQAATSSTYTSKFNSRGPQHILCPLAQGGISWLLFITFGQWHPLHVLWHLTLGTQAASWLWHMVEIREVCLTTTPPPLWCEWREGDAARLWMMSDGYFFIFI